MVAEKSKSLIHKRKKWKPQKQDWFILVFSILVTLFMLKLINMYLVTQFKGTFRNETERDIIERGMWQYMDTVANENALQFETKIREFHTAVDEDNLEEILKPQENEQ